MRKSNGKKSITIVAGLFIVVVAAIFIIKGITGPEAGSAPQGEDLKIPVGEVSEKANFYPYTVGNKKMEVIALKASDGTIRTAFNTCQVCFDSGRGYYKQEGNELVCQNCGNRFSADQVELVKGGCNPVPIVKENKTEDGTYITINADFLEQNKGLFANWKTR